MSSPPFSLLAVRHGSRTARVAVAPCVAAGELASVVGAALRVDPLEYAVVGLETADGLALPLSLASASPAAFLERGVFTPILERLAPPPARDGAVAPASPPPFSERPAPPRRLLSFLGSHAGPAAACGLDRVSPHAVVEAFREAASSEGLIDGPGFERCLLGVLRRSGAGDGQSSPRIHRTARRIFELFDTDQSGHVDVAEFVAGLTVLCGARAEDGDAALAAFSLFDLDSDGRVSRDEMVAYLSSFFEVVFALDSEAARRFDGSSARQVAIYTAEAMFRDADLDLSGDISLDEFREWYTGSASAQAVFVPRA